VWFAGTGMAWHVAVVSSGCDVSIVMLVFGGQGVCVHYDEHQDADEVVELVKKEGRKCLKFAGDVSKPDVRPGLRGCVWLSWPIAWSPTVGVCGGCWHSAPLEVCGIMQQAAS
jgi:hypothetical protein